MLSLIAAISENRVIGEKQGIPWYFPEDLKIFKEITYGKKIIMGRKTYELLPKKLKGRSYIG